IFLSFMFFDFSTVFMNKRISQTGADAAAMAATEQLKNSYEEDLKDEMEDRLEWFKNRIEYMEEHPDEEDEEDEEDQNDDGENGDDDLTPEEKYEEIIKDLKEEGWKVEYGQIGFPLEWGNAFPANLNEDFIEELS